MIKLQLLMAVICSFIVSCQLPNKDKVIEFAPGMYVKAIDHAYAKGADTLIIRAMNATTFEIIKRSGFTRIRNGKVLPYVHTQETWTGIYDAEKQVILEQQKGKVLSFDLEKKQVRVGGTPYDRITL